MHKIMPPMKKTALALLFCGFASSANAESFNEAMHALNRDIYKTVSAPAHFDRKDWLIAGAVAGGAVALYSLDGEVRDLFQRNRGGTTNSIEDVFKSAGRLETAMPAFVLLYAGGMVFDNAKLQKTALVSLESFLVSGLIFEGVKFATHRDRPSENSSPYQWHGPGFYSAHQSFPSGDAATAFALLTPVAHYYGDTPAIAPLAYGTAALASLGRVNHNEHWSSDIFVGAALGYFTAKAVIKYRESGTTVSLLPMLDGNSKGLLLANRF